MAKKLALNNTELNLTVTWCYRQNWLDIIKIKKYNIFKLKKQILINQINISDKFLNTSDFLFINKKPLGNSINATDQRIKSCELFSNSYPKKHLFFSNYNGEKNFKTTLHFL